MPSDESSSREPRTLPAKKERPSIAELKRAFDNIGFNVRPDGIESYNWGTGSNGWQILNSGVIKLGDSTSVHLVFDGPNVRIRSSNYVAGVSGFTIEPTLIEAENLVARGILRGATFMYDVISSVGGQVIVANSDTLDADMTALDASTLMTKGTTTWAVNDMVVVRAVTASGIQEEWLRITNIASAPTYTVTRDLAGSFAANSNPIWQKGTVIVKQGSSDGAAAYSGGWLKMLGEGTNSPHYSVFSRTGVAYNSYSERVRIGNVNGLAGIVATAFGIFAGDYSANKYFLYDDVSGNLTLNGLVNGLFGFGGDGSDGALSVLAGTTTLNLDQVYNYSSINVAAGATLTFTGSGALGILNCSGNCTIAGTIELRNLVTTQTSRSTRRDNFTTGNGQTFTGSVGGTGGQSTNGGDGGTGGTSTTASGTPGVGGAAGAGAGAAGGNGSGGNSSVGGGGGGGGDSQDAAGFATAGATTATVNGGNGGNGSTFNAGNNDGGCGGGGGGGYNTGNGGNGGTGGTGGGDGGAGGNGGASGANGGNGGNGGQGGQGGTAGFGTSSGEGGTGGAGYTNGGNGGQGGTGSANAAPGGAGTGGIGYYGTGGTGGQGGTASAAGAATAGGIGGAGRTGGIGGVGGSGTGALNPGTGGRGGRGTTGSAAFVLYCLGTMNLNGMTINAQGGTGGTGGAGGTGGTGNSNGGQGGDGGDAADIIMLSIGTLSGTYTVNNSGGTAGAGGAGQGTGTNGTSGTAGDDGAQIIAQLINT